MPDVAMDGLGSEDGDGSEDDDDGNGTTIPRVPMSPPASSTEEERMDYEPTKPALATAPPRRKLGMVGGRKVAVRTMPWMDMYELH